MSYWFSGNVTGMYNQCCFIDCLVPPPPYWFTQFYRPVGLWLTLSTPVYVLFLIKTLFLNAKKQSAFTYLCTRDVWRYERWRKGRSRNCLRTFRLGFFFFFWESNYWLLVVVVFTIDLGTCALRYVFYKYQEQKTCCSINIEYRMRIGEEARRRRR